MKSILQKSIVATATVITAEVVKKEFFNYENNNLQDSIHSLAKANKSLVKLNRIQQEKMENLLLKTKELQDQNNDLVNQHNFIYNKNTHEKSKILEAINQSTEEKSKIAETILRETKELKNEFTHNNILGFLENYVDAYKEFLSTLHIGQLACLMNILMLLMIFSSINGLIMNYYGNLIINHLNLESKFPQLAKFISLRSKLSDKLKKFQIIYLYVIVLISLAVNIYMFI